MGGSEINSKFILSGNVLLKSWINLFVCALFHFGLRSHVLCCRLNPNKLILKGVNVVTPAKVPGLCAETATMSTLLGASKLQNIIREREQRTVFDLVDDMFVARFQTILPAPIELSKQLTTNVRSLPQPVRHALCVLFVLVWDICRCCHPVMFQQESCQVAL